VTITDAELRAATRQLVKDLGASTADQYAFRGAQFDRGLAWVHFPAGKGGLGLAPGRQAVVQQELRDAGVRYSNIFINQIGIGMAAPTLLAFGSEAMQEAHLRRIFTGEDLWCQLFSEPGHGSDLAGLSCRGVRSGDHWVISGQKVWTSLAHVASFGLLLVRTSPNVPKHAGLTYLVVDMASPGIEIRPLYQLTGDAEFNEVFFTDVTVPDSNRLGDEGAGWKVAITTLMNERSTLGGTGGGRESASMQHLINTWQSCRNSSHAWRTVMRDQLVRVWISSELHRLTNARSRSNRAVGPEGSIGKLVFAELSKVTFELAIDLLGPEGMLHPDGYPMTRTSWPKVNHVLSTTPAFLRTRASSIEGGTTEILKNVIAERVLGLPSDLRVDHGIPWIEIARSPVNMSRLNRTREH
jgi:alkylation response protein AidB-like acyl-CoA dehydrogenase